MTAMPGRILLFTLLLPLTAIAAPDALGHQAAGHVQVVSIIAERFAFTPSEVRVKAGVPMRIELRSDDTAHGFRILGTDVNVEIPKRSRGVATVTFTPTEGEYTFECAKLCGAGHSFMRGAVIATR